MLLSGPTTRQAAPRLGTRRDRVVGSRIRSGRYAGCYLAPALAIFAVFTLGPGLFVLFISFFDWDQLNTSMSRFVGGDNYSTLVGSSQFWHSVLISVYFGGFSVAANVVLGLGIALLLAGKGVVRSVARLAVLLPYFTPVVATSLVWIWIFDPQFGLLDWMLHAVHLPQQNWLESTTWALPAVTFYTLWHNLGFSVLIFIAALATVPTVLRDAAKADGAGRWQEVRYVLLPQIAPVTLFVVVITTIASLQAFTQFYTMTGGGPLGATTTVGYLLYEQSFVFYHTGEGAAVAVVLFVVIALFTLAQMRLRARSATNAT